jgi:uncharacterized membrane protein (DUF485 family)
MKKFLEKIQKLPEAKKKIILWTIVVILGLVFFGWYFVNIKLAAFDKEKLQDDLKFQDLKDDLNQLPKFELPNL